MRKLFIGLIIVAVVAAAGWLAWTRTEASPTTQETLSKTDVKAAPEKVFAVIEDFRQWKSWSPHENAEPAARRTFSGPPSGVGAVYAWDGGEAVGAGRAEITEAIRPSRIVVGVDATRPVAGHLDLTFGIRQAAGNTEVEVTTSGSSALVTAVMKMFFGGDLIRLACAAEESHAALCTFFMKDLTSPRL